jgi:hypothetical protein
MEFAPKALKIAGLKSNSKNSNLQRKKVVRIKSFKSPKISNFRIEAYKGLNLEPKFLTWIPFKLEKALV